MLGRNQYEIDSLHPTLALLYLSLYDSSGTPAVSGDCASSVTQPATGTYRFVLTGSVGDIKHATAHGTAGDVVVVVEAIKYAADTVEVELKDDAGAAYDITGKSPVSICLHLKGS